ncbi:MAG: alpha/beta fold hydrolase [Streptosporangiaceae bacterium]
MPTFAAPDGTRLSYQLRGTGAPLVCVPGGPMRASAYLGDLGGLAGHRQLIVLDLRGTGQSAIPDDPASYRCDRQVDDVAALQAHLGLDRVDLLAHSAGANIALQYTARYPHRVSKLALITPSGRAVDLEPDPATRREVVNRRQDEPWFPAAVAAFDRIDADAAGDDDWTSIAPFFYGRWDDAARAHEAADQEQTNQAAASVFLGEGAFDSAATRAALAAFGAPVLVLAGEVDLSRPPAVLAECAKLFPAGHLVMQSGAGHYPWLDDADEFVSTVNAFLDAPG